MAATVIISARSGEASCKQKVGLALQAPGKARLRAAWPAPGHSGVWGGGWLLGQRRDAARLLQSVIGSPQLRGSHGGTESADSIAL